MKKQLRSSRIISGIIGIAAAGLIAVLVIVTPQAVRALSSADRMMKELEEAHLTETVKEISELTKSSQKNMGQTMDKLEQLDLEGLNSAIQNLENTTRPLAELFGR